MDKAPLSRVFLHAFSVVMLLLAGLALALGRLQLAFICVSVVALAWVPAVVANRLHVRLPAAFLVATALFLFASLFLGEAFDFYNRVWWWDLALHASSAIGFGLAGFLFVFMLFEGDRYAAPPWALGFIATCVAIAVGSLWEVFEYSMDSVFGLNMQKSGTDDIMGDIIVNTLGAAVGGFSGSLYLKGVRSGVLVAPITQFVRLNRGLFRKTRLRFRRRPEAPPQPAPEGREVERDHHQPERQHP